MKSQNITEILWMPFRLIFMWDVLKKAYKVGIYSIYIYQLAPTRYKSFPTVYLLTT